jgi:endoglucanase
VPVNPTYPETYTHAHVQEKLDAVVGMVNTSARTISGNGSLQASDDNHIVVYDGTVDAIITVPSTLPVGRYHVLSTSLMRLEIVAGAGATVNGTVLVDQYVMATVTVYQNGDGNSAKAVVSGGRQPSALLVKPGINLGGGEFSHTIIPGVLGTNYTYPTTTWNNIDTGDLSGFAYWQSKGMRIIRLPFKWDRIQRTLGGALYETDMAYIDNAVAQTAALGMWLILDVHNSAYYNISGTDYKIGSAQVTQAHFNDLWTRLANRYKNYPHVMFGLMNEPDDTWTAAAWRDIALQTVSAIRATGATNTILIQGVYWSGAYSWTAEWAGGGNGQAWAGRLPDGCLLEMHHYLDPPVSGAYSSTPYCATGAGEWLQWATAWLRDNGYRGFLGEFGYPHDAGGFNSCPPEADKVFDHLAANADVWWGFTLWSGGPWVRTGGNPATMSLEPENGDRPQIVDVMSRTWDLSSAPQ